MNLEQRMRDRNRENSYRTAGILFFLLLMAAGFVIGTTLIFLRPRTSELEKRDLTEFPKFTLQSFLSGEYTSSIETWYSDTFPFRESLLKTEQTVKTYYGLRNDAINNIGEGDEGPDFDDMIASLESENAEKSKESEQESGSESRETPSESASEDSSASETESTPAESTPTESEATTESTVETEDPSELADEGKEIAEMNPQEAGAVNIKDLVGYCVYGFNMKAADHYGENVADVAEGLKGISDVYSILIPNNSAIKLDAETKAAWKLIDEDKAIQYYNAKMHNLSQEIHTVNIYDILMEHHDEYLYFKTDHHWTQLGAYYAYVEFCKAAGLEPYEIDSYAQEVTPDFLGSYYATNGYTQLKDNPDTIIAYKPHMVEWFEFYDTMAETMRRGRLIRNMSEFSPTVKYLGFIYGDNPYSLIVNPDIGNGRSCIIVKESFGNTFVPFLADHFEKVIVIDYRTYKDSVVQLAKEEKITDVIFINNLEAISDTWIMDVLGNICK